jgi:hypothetical protein
VKKSEFVILRAAPKMHLIPEVGERLYGAPVRREGREGPPLHGLREPRSIFMHFREPRALGGSEASVPSLKTKMTGPDGFFTASKRKGQFGDGGETTTGAFS